MWIESQFSKEESPLDQYQLIPRVNLFFTILTKSLHPYLTLFFHIILAHNSTSFCVSRFPAAPQLLTKLVTGQMACGAVMVPTTMFMGQVVTPFAPQQSQNQTISIGQQTNASSQEQQAQTQAVSQQQSQSQAQLSQTQFLQVSTYRGSHDPVIHCMTDAGYVITVRPYSI